MNRLFLPILFICLLFTGTPALAQTFSGKVVSIADGDTITVLDGNKRQHKIRLYGIDTPEKRQVFGQAAKKHTSNLVARKTVQVTSYGTDRYGRTIGVVVVDGVNVNQSLIANGFAWQYRKYCKASFCDGWLKLEKKARSANIGLWSDADPEPPWDWRKGVRNGGRGTNKTGGKAYPPVYDGYHGNTKSHIFHSPTCRYYNCKNCNETFKTRDKAIAAGYRPCGQCKPYRDK